MIKQAVAQKEVSTKLTKGLLDMIILQFLNAEPMHGYQVISKIRKNFGIYFGPSTIYPLLGTLEKKGYVDSHWNMNFDRPRKVYSLTAAGQSILNFTEESLNLICRKLTITNQEENHPMVSIIATKSRDHLSIEIPETGKSWACQQFYLKLSPS
ncbi:MAG TPA: PadR family transcriptional regulator [Candidatus Deferrimicrobiaceae bacterium]|nr:PadR family transcriptional regulator [Candidatus Deferrimicrobiaceae bacterium]